MSATKLTLDYALEQRRRLRSDVERRENILRYRYPLYGNWRDMNGKAGTDAGVDFFSAAEKSGAFRSYEWLFLYMAIARLEVWGKIASLLCEEEFGEHEFTIEPDVGAGLKPAPTCMRCGLHW